MDVKGMILGKLHEKKKREQSARKQIAPIIMTDANAFVYCFFCLNKKRCT
jgi:hypothetical protein